LAAVSFFHWKSNQLLIATTQAITGLQHWATITDGLAFKGIEDDRE
jgi:hypothetical protein